ncbi:MAG: hypothetical protein LBJ92_01400 [Holosporales bacterium]|jgi:hypothetical protein|nr:hypothetical protein [Holosporales bacterium]
MLNNKIKVLVLCLLSSVCREGHATKTDAVASVEGQLPYSVDEYLCDITQSGTKLLPGTVEKSERVVWKAVGKDRLVADFVKVLTGVHMSSVFSPDAGDPGQIDRLRNFGYRFPSIGQMIFRVINPIKDRASPDSYQVYWGFKDNPLTSIVNNAYRDSTDPSVAASRALQRVLCEVNLGRTDQDARIRDIINQNSKIDGTDAISQMWKTFKEEFINPPRILE